MILLACIRCGHRMKHASESGMGPRCARSVQSAKPKRRQRQARPTRDTRTPDMFEEARP